MVRYVAAVAQAYVPAAVGSRQRYGVGALQTEALQLKSVHSPDLQSWYLPRQAAAGSVADGAAGSAEDDVVASAERIVTSWSAIVSARR